MYSEHFDNVAKLIKKVKSPPSKIRWLFSTLIIIPSTIIFLLAIILLIISVIVWVLPIDSGTMFAITKYFFFVGVGGLVFSVFLFRSYNKGVTRFKNTQILRKDFKLKILPSLIKEEYPNTSYKFDGIVDRTHILDSDFFSSDFRNALRHEWFFGDDYFSGDIEGVDFEFCELYYKTEGLTLLGYGALFFVAWISLSIFGGVGGGGDGSVFDLLPESDSDSDDSDLLDDDYDDYDDDRPNKLSEQKVDEKPFFYGAKTNFQGFFLYADFHKDFEGEVFIRTKNKFSTKIFDFSSKKLKKIKPENRAIDKKYEIKATHEQVGYYVLSPAIIEAIERLNKRLGSDLSMTLKNGKLYLIAPQNKDFFENIIIKKNTISANTIDEVKKDLLVIRDLLLEFNLNNRIWSKV